MIGCITGYDNPTMTPRNPLNHPGVNRSLLVPASPPPPAGGGRYLNLEQTVTELQPDLSQTIGGNMTIKKKVILIVDDNEALVCALETLLADDYAVIAATDAYQALDVLYRTEPSLIFLDCFMPGYHGLQLLREIRQMSLNSRVVIITAAESHLLGDEISELGVDGFLMKPFNVQDIEGFAAAA
jgi:CheY-like chemotaxis protein